MNDAPRPLPSRLRAFLSRLRQAARVRRFAALERLLPVRRGRWCFCAWPGEYAHTVDNPRAVFEAVKDDPAIEKVILTRGPASRAAALAAEGRNVTFVDVESLRGMYLLATCEVLFLGYGIRALCSYGDAVTAKHRIVQVWHGIPLKRIGRLCPTEGWWAAETHKYAATVCSAPRDRELMSAAFAPLAPERTWLTGLPRNDTILKPEAELPADYRRMLDDVRRRLDGRRLVLYVPTWRDKSAGIYEFSDAEHARLAETLARHGAVFGVRGHANRRAGGPDTDGDVLTLNGIPDANLLLRLADVVLTDYSSIYIDFMLTGRPVVHFTYDVDSYVRERGFLYTLDEALAGPAHRTFDAVLADLDASLAPGWAPGPQYQAARALFHDHGDRVGEAVAARVRQLVAGA